MTSSLSNVPLLSSLVHHPTPLEQAQLSLESLASAVAALQAGKMPTTSQLNAILQKLLKSNVLQPDIGSRYAGRVGGGKLSKGGREVVERAREVVQSVVRVGLEKNDDDKIQRFIHAASQASVDVEGNLETPDIPLPSSRELQDAHEALHQLLTSLLTSPSLRRLLGSAINLSRELFADAAEQVANASIEVTKASKKASRKAREGEKEGEGVEDKEWDEGLEEVWEYRKKAGRKAEDVRDEAVKRAGRRVKEIKTYVDEQLPTDAKDRVVEKFKAIINEVQNDPQYEDAIDTLFSILSKYASATRDAVIEAADQSTADVEANQQAETAATLFRQIIESFTGPLDSVFRAADKVIKDLDGDERIKNLVDEAYAFIDRAIHDPGYVTSSRAQRRGEAIYDQAQEIVTSNAAWKRDADALVKEISAALDKAEKDQALRGLGRSLDRFADSLKRFSRRGMSLFEGSEVWGDLTQVLLPRVLGALQCIPMPRVEFTSADVDLILDQIKFTADSFIPDAAHFTNHNEVKVHKGYAAYASDFNTSTTLSMSGLRLQALDISYYVNKKTGWIGLEDSGFLDVFVGTPGPNADDGLDVTLTIENATSEDRETFFVLKKVEVVIQGFTIKVRGSKHPITNWFARGAIRSYLEKQLVGAMEEKIGELFEAADLAAFKVQQRAIAANAAAPNPMAYLQALFTPSSASSALSFTNTGLTKVGPQGAWILAVGVEEELLPGKRTALGRKGDDVVAKKRTAESLMEEGQSAFEEGVDKARQAAYDAQDEVEKLEEEYDDAKASETRRDGWKSSAFDL
ncbi:hypothetical protein MNV49_003440 [Pseudohyphozyma bogoriensis]|nr:hypothetical protein MNV49_003440 [Pseudohyphozyma bogoriensis]